MGISAKCGDLFSVPLDETSMGLGVVARKWKDELYLVIFKERFSVEADINDVALASLTPLLASSSLDAKIWHGHWPIIRRNVDTSMIEQPIYKVEESGGTVAESFDRKFRKMIGTKAAQQLSYRKGVAPVRLENAIKAHHGIGSWDPIFEELSYERVLSSIEVISATRSN